MKCSVFETVNGNLAEILEARSYNNLVAVGDFIVQAAEVVAKAALQLWSMTVSVVQKAVEVIRKIVDAAINWLVGAIKAMVKNYIEPFLKKIWERIYSIGEGLWEAAKKGKEAMSSYFVTHILPVILAVGSAMFVMSVVIGKLLDINPLWGGIALGLISAGLTAVVLGTIMTSEYYERGKNMDSSAEGIKRWLHSVNPAISTTYNSVVDFWGPIFLYSILGDESGKKMLKAIGVYFVSIFASIGFMLWRPPTLISGTVMLPFLAMATVSGGSTILTIAKSIFLGWRSMDIGTKAALGVIGFLLFLSASMTVASDLGYVADAFT